MNLEQARSFLAREFPQNTSTIEEIAPGESVLRQVVSEGHLRPGGTVSGPTMMALADCAAYVAILGKIGEVALAVTTSLNINFLRKPAADRDLIAKCGLLKSGKRLMVCEVHVYSEGVDEAVAHVTATYSIPPVTRPGQE
jgi:uncharacterized protein (TIGR00369 family)